MNIENYKIIEQRDCNGGRVLGFILLNKKHSVNEFQKAIWNAKDKCKNLINKYGDDWYFISKEIRDKFDYFDIDLPSNDYIEF